MTAVAWAIGRGSDGNNSISSLTSGSQSPTNGNMLVAYVISNISSGTPAVPTMGGTLGAIWTQLGTFQYQTSTANDTRITVFYSLMATTATGTITFDWGGVTQTAASMQIGEYSSGATRSVWFPQAFVTATGTGASGSVTLATLQDANSLAIGVIGHNVAESITVGSGFTIRGNSFFAPEISIEDKTNTTTVNASWTSSAYGMIGFEMAAIPTANWPFRPAPILKGP